MLYLKVFLKYTTDPDDKLKISKYKYEFMTV